ncbi:Uncharacterized protein Fot_03230 [Forsythia ovata]|uniref:Uncharacterized protein n=1 Tax=Forsythia ovata TaxID=205694 RepID=A0ABD1X943_9LAMI
MEAMKTFITFIQNVTISLQSFITFKTFLHSKTFLLDLQNNFTPSQDSKIPKQSSLIIIPSKRTTPVLSPTLFLGSNGLLVMSSKARKSERWDILRKSFFCWESNEA